MQLHKLKAHSNKVVIDNTGCFIFNLKYIEIKSSNAYTYTLSIFAINDNFVHNTGNFILVQHNMRDYYFMDNV